MVTENVREDKSKMSAKQWENVSFCGYPNINRFFIPHLTLTKFRNFNEHALKNMSVKKFPLKVNRIGIFYLGKFGICRTLVQSFNLK